MKCFQSWSVFIPLLLSIGYFIWTRIYTKDNYVFHQHFFERDPALSQPYIENTYVSNNLLAIFSTCVSESALLFSLMYFCFSTNNKKFMDYFVVTHSGFLTTLLLNSAITNTLKVIFGVPRPNFYALCNYHGYRDAWSSGNFSEYFMLTEPGQIGNTDNCLSKSDILDSFLSFPCDYSSLMFASVTYVTLVLAQHKTITTFSHHLICCLTGCLYVFASWISISRVLDYESGVYDILAGCFVGTVIGYMVYKYVDVLLKSVPGWNKLMHINCEEVQITNDATDETKLTPVVTV